MSWIKKVFKKVFRRHSGDSEATNPPVEIPDKDNAGSSAPTSGIKIALIRGHGGNDSGATGNSTSEVLYNTWVMDYVEANTKRNLKCFKSSSSANAVLASLAYMPDVTIQLHLNSFNGQAFGCEVLVLESDKKSFPIAEKFAKDFTEKFGRKMRRPETNGKKLLKSGDRGAGSLYGTKRGIKILVEPFFIDSKTDFVAKEDYAKFLLDFINQL